MEVGLRRAERSDIKAILELLPLQFKEEYTEDLIRKRFGDIDLANVL
jgi:N-acetylglutamate synthase-like GNAT family acetyltransferase